MNPRAVTFLRKQSSALSEDDRYELLFAALLVAVALAAQWIDSPILNHALRFVGAYGVLAILAAYGYEITRIAAPGLRRRLAAYRVALYLLVPAALAVFLFVGLGDRLHGGWTAQVLLWVGYAAAAFLAALLVKYARWPAAMPESRSGSR